MYIYFIYIYSFFSLVRLFCATFHTNTCCLRRLASRITVHVDSPERHEETEINREREREEEGEKVWKRMDIYREDNRAQFLASLLWSGFTPRSFPPSPSFLPSFSPPPPPPPPPLPLLPVDRPQTSSSPHRGFEVKG